eukprot:754153-Hanusia_phi.AAC.4
MTSQDVRLTPRSAAASMVTMDFFSREFESMAERFLQGRPNSSVAGNHNVSQGAREPASRGRQEEVEGRAEEAAGCSPQLASILEE